MNTSTDHSPSPSPEAGTATTAASVAPAAAHAAAGKPAKAGKSSKPAKTAKPVKAKAVKAKAAVPAKPAKAATKPVKASKPAKPVKPAKPAAPAAPVAPAADEKPAPKAKEKLVRDSFTLPAADHALLAQLKARAVAFQHPAKKSELVRAGLQALAALPDATLQALLGQLTPVKTGRPRKGH